MKTYRAVRMLVVSVLVLFAGCMPMQVSSTNQLSPGMSTAQVQTILGGPSQTQFIADKWIWKYSLHQPWKGFIPYYLVFASESQTLEGWFADEAEYARQQQLWLQAFPPPQRHDVDIHIHRK